MKFVFFLRFDLKPLPFTNSTGWKYPLHLTTGSSSEKIPMVYHLSKLPILRVQYTGGGFNTYYDYKELDRSKWTQIEISQKKVGSPSRYIYSVKIDNDEKVTKFNDKAKEFFDVKVYSSIPLYPAEGSIRNMLINPEGKTIDPFTEYLRGQVFEFRRVKK